MNLELLIATGRATDTELKESGISYRDVAAIKSECPFQVRGSAFKLDRQNKDDEERRVVRYIMSTEDVDRMGDIIRVYGGTHNKEGATEKGKGWQLGHFQKNKQFLWSHESWNPPLGNVERARKDKLIEGDGKLKPALVGEVEFFDKDISPFADTIYKAARAGKLAGNSVGFLPKKTNKFESAEERGALGLGDNGVEFIECELLEDSACSVPANPFALAQPGERAVKAWDELVAEGIVERSEVEALARHYPLTEADAAARLAEKTRSFVDFGRRIDPMSNDTGTLTQPVTLSTPTPTQLKTIEKLAVEASDRMSDAEELLGRILDVIGGDDDDDTKSEAPVDVLHRIERLLEQLNTRSGGQVGSDPEPVDHAPDTDEGSVDRNTKALLAGAAEMVDQLRRELITNRCKPNV